MTHFGEELGRIRGARNLKKSELARLCGLSVATLSRAEDKSTCILSNNSVVMLLDAFSKTQPPLSTAEAVWFADQSGIDRRIALSYVHNARPTSDADSLAMAVSELTSVIGVSSAHNILRAVLEAVKSTQAPSKARSLVVKHAPVQRDGFTEQVEVEYTERDPTPPGSAAAGF